MEAALRNLARAKETLDEGVVAAIGHTRNTASQIADAVSAGATLSTHLGNGADAVLPRYNYIWEQLSLTIV